MQGFEMLLYGTEARPQTPCTTASSKKWIAGSKGFKDALTFVETVYKEKLGPDVEDALDPNIGTRVRGEFLPEGKLAINLDGSWLAQDWLPDSGHEWPEWSTKLGLAAMPTQNGQAPGKVSMSGGWTWSIPAKAGNPDLAFEFIKTMQTKANAQKWYIANSRHRGPRGRGGGPGVRRRPARHQVLHRTWSRARTTGPRIRRTRRSRRPSRRRWRA